MLNYMMLLIHCDVENIIYVLFGDLLKKKHLNSLHDCIISVNYRF